jgi:UDP-GlcNAc:undecaprenyl-phosphate GlcNAc-1-phosphate transferase
MIISFLIILNIIIFINFEKLSKKLNFFDEPNSKRKIHYKPVANIGGIIIFINIVALVIYQIFIQQEKTYLLILLPFISLILLIGLIDDRKDLNPNLKILLFTVIIFILIFQNKNYLITNLQMSFLEKKIEFGIISYFFTIFCFLAFINSINMFDGINLHTSIYASFVVIIFLLKNQFVDLCVAILIPILFFTYFNYKNRCFIGNNGTYLLSFIFSCLFISSYNKSYLFLPEEIFLIMFLPGVELIRLTFSRLLKKKHPFKADKNHVHHLLLHKYSFKKTILISSFFVLMPYLIAQIFNNNYLIIISIFILAYFYLIYFLKKNIKNV